MIQEILPTIFFIIILMCSVAFLIAGIVKDRRKRASQPAEARLPFPQHQAYCEGSIKPNHVEQNQLDDAVTTYYKEWKQRFLLPDDEPGHYYVLCKMQKKFTRYQMHAVSEGMGYGMIITALMAGHDPEAKKYFDGLYQFVKAHPSSNHPALMSWQASANTFNFKGSDSATDGDMDITQALLLADRQWGSDGNIDYREDALRMIAALKEQAFHPTAFYPLLGDWVTPDKPKFFNGMRSADVMPTHFRCFLQASGDDFWQKVDQHTLQAFKALQKSASPHTGLLPDFIVFDQQKPQPAPENFLESEYDGQYWYNACRIPLRLGLAYLISGEQRYAAVLQPATRWLQKSTQADPSQIKAGYTLKGEALAESTHLAFSAPLAVAAMCNAENQHWLNRLWDEINNQPIDADNYYGCTLKLLCMLAISGNWWSAS